LDYGPFAADGILWVSDRQQIDFVLLSLVNIFGCGFATCCSEIVLLPLHFEQVVQIEFKIAFRAWEVYKHQGKRYTTRPTESQREAVDGFGLLKEPQDYLQQCGMT